MTGCFVSIAHRRIVVIRLLNRAAFGRLPQSCSSLRVGFGASAHIGSNTGPPHKGNGEKYLLLLLGYTGEVPGGYFILRSPTFCGRLL